MKSTSLAGRPVLIVEDEPLTTIGIGVLVEEACASVLTSLPLLSAPSSTIINLGRPFRSGTVRG